MRPWPTLPATLSAPRRRPISRPSWITRRRRIWQAWPPGRIHIATPRPASSRSRITSLTRTTTRRQVAGSCIAEIAAPRAVWSGPSATMWVASMEMALRRCELMCLADHQSAGYHTQRFRTQYRSHGNHIDVANCGILMLTVPQFIVHVSHTTSWRTSSRS